jgi:predicted phage tail protein
MPTEAQDSLQSIAIANIVDLVSEGEIFGLTDGLRSVYLNETPLQNADGSLNFKDVQVVVTNGTQKQSALTGFSGVESEISVETEVVKATPVVRTITNADIDAVRVRIAIPALSSADTSNGNLNGTTVEYAIDLQSNGGGYVPQIIGNTWLTTNMDIQSGSLQANANTSIRRAQISVVNPNDATTYTVEYKLRSSGTWLTTGITVQDSQIDVNEGFWDYDGGYYTQTFSYDMKTYIMPTQENGLWDMRVTNIVLASGASNPYINTASGNIGLPSAKAIGKTTSKYERSFRIDLTGSAPWNIRVRRITDDSTSAYLQNSTFWSSYTEIINNKFRYPNSALIGIKLDASQFDNIPRRAYDLKLLKVKIPSNYNPVTRVYTGVWDGTFVRAWTDNPAWCFYDLLTNTRYGLGNFLPAAQIDKFTLYAIAQYCDELVPDGFGGTEPRYTCNVYLQNQDEAYTLINRMASIFRGMPYWSSGAITLGYDAPSDPVYQFTNANVLNGDFNYIGSSKSTRHTVALVTWNDPEDLYKQKVEYVEDKDGIARYGILQTEVVAVGCTSRGQANRVGKWLLYTEQLETEVVTFKAGIEGNIVRPSDVIQIADENRAGTRMGGRVVSSTTTSVTLDQDVASISGIVGSTFSVLMMDGTLASRTVASVSGSVVTLSTALPLTPQANTVWMLQTSGILAQLFRVISCSEEEGAINISALAYNPSKYNAIELGLDLKPRDITDLNEVLPAPTGFNATESLYWQGSSIKVLVTLSWTPVSKAKQYEVSYKIGDGNFITLPITSNPSIDIRNTIAGEFTFKVATINAFGIFGNKGAVGTYTKTILGKTAPPSNVTGLAVTFNRLIGVTLDWTNITDIDLSAYEIRTGNTTSTWATSTFLAKVKASTYKLSTQPSATTKYFVKAIDTSGFYSTTAAEVTFTYTAPSNPTAVTQTIVKTTKTVVELALDWNDVTLTSTQYALGGYEIRTANSSWGTATGFLYRGNASAARLKNISATATTTFYLRAYDVNKNYATASLTFSHNVTNPVTMATATVSVTRIKSILQFSINSAPTRPNDFDEYEFQIGQVATPVGIPDGTTDNFWNDADCLIVDSTTTKAQIDVKLFPNPRFSTSGVKYRVAVRMRDKSGNYSPASALGSITINTIA